MEELRDMIFCGDIHGDWKEFIWTALTKLGIRKADIVVICDFGIEFDKTMTELYKWVEQKLEFATVTI